MHTITDSRIDSLWNDSVTRTYSKGRSIFTEGDRPGHLYRVVDGRVRVERRSSDGRIVLLNVMGPGDVFGVDGLLDHGARTDCAVTMTDAHVLALDRARLLARVAADAEVSDYLLRILARRIRHSSVHIADVMSADVQTRVAKKLLYLAQRFGEQCDGEVVFTMDLTQEQLAHFVGTSRESLNKILSEFAGSGWIRLDGNRIGIRDTQPLAERMR